MSGPSEEREGVTVDPLSELGSRPNREGWYIGDGGQLRRDPVRKLRWDREGIHALVGLFAAVLLSYADNPALIAGSVMFFVGFLAYEITEGWRIKDWAYRDIGGYLVGLGVGLAAATALGQLG